MSVVYFLFVANKHRS